MFKLLARKQQKIAERVRQSQSVSSEEEPSSTVPYPDYVSGGMREGGREGRTDGWSEGGTEGGREEGIGLRHE